MDISAFFIRNVIFPLMEKIKGNTIRKKLRILQQLCYSSKEEVENFQKEELKNLLLYCIDNVPAYKELKYLKEKIEKDPIAAISEFPVLEKKNFMKNFDYFLSERADISKCILNRTGGSTGEPVKFYIDRETVEWYEAARYLGLSWWGINIGDRCLMLWASRNDIRNSNNLKEKIKERFLKNRLIISSWDINEKNLKEIVRKIKRFKPLYIYAYPSAAYKLAYLLNENAIDLNLKLKGIVTTAENLYEHQRELIEKVFKCPVINEYGARDAGIIAYQCPQGKIHVISPNIYLEFIKIGSLDEERRVLLSTDLHNFVMPRLRYKLGDIVSVDDEGCNCNIAFPVIKEIDGRVDEVLITRSGKCYDSHFLTTIMREIEVESILQYQLIQHSLDNLTLKIIKSDKFDENEIHKIIKLISEKMDGARVDVQYVSNIETGPSGKIRYLIREFHFSVKDKIVV